MGSLWGVFMGFKAAGDFTGLGVPGTPGALLLFDPKSFERPKGAPVLGMGGWAGFCGEPVGNPGSSAERNDGSANLVSKLLFDRKDAS